MANVEGRATAITVLTPVKLGCWTTRQPLPQVILDAGGAALGGKLYVIAGKTSAGPQSSTPFRQM